MKRLSLRLRLTLVFTLVMAVVLGLTGLFLYTRFRADLDNQIANSLKSRADQVASLVHQTDDGAPRALARATGSGDDFAEVLTPDGQVATATPNLHGVPLLRRQALQKADRGAIARDHPPIPHLEGSLRLRALPVNTPRGHRIVVVGTTLADRHDSLRTLAVLLGIGGGVALLLAALAGYGVAAGALRPVESMRRRAAGISPSVSGGRLPVPESSDEIARLGVTLNDMLARLEEAFARERRFVADASHELRTPLGILKAELELALRSGRSPEELRAALESAAEETDRLVALAEDLLVIARMDQGRLPLRRADVDVHDLLTELARRYEGRAGGRSVGVSANSDVRLSADRTRLDQALGNMIDNAVRYGSGNIGLRSVVHDSLVELHVEDSGPGFDPEFIDEAFERFARADEARSRGGVGLGLAIAAAVATSHGGHAHAANREEGGADVWLELPVDRVHHGVEPAISAS
jgi:heavy metal sensor kinase